MALEVKAQCERYTANLDKYSIAYICLHECTFFVDCTKNMSHVCSNCGGELVRRPKMGLIEVSYPIN